MDAAQRRWEKTFTNELITEENLDIYEATWGAHNSSMAKAKITGIVITKNGTCKWLFLCQISGNLKEISFLRHHKPPNFIRGRTTEFREQK